MSNFNSLNVSRESFKSHEAGYWDARKEAFRLIRDLGECIWEVTLQIDTSDTWESEAEMNDVYRRIESWKEELRANPMVREIYHALGADEEDMFIDCAKHQNLFRL